MCESEWRGGGGGGAQLLQTFSSLVANGKFIRAGRQNIIHAYIYIRCAVLDGVNPKGMNAHTAYSIHLLIIIIYLIKLKKNRLENLNGKSFIILYKHLLNP